MKIIDETRAGELLMAMLAPQRQAIDEYLASLKTVHLTPTNVRKGGDAGIEGLVACWPDTAALNETNFRLQRELTSSRAANQLLRSDTTVLEKRIAELEWNKTDREQAAHSWRESAEKYKAQLASVPKAMNQEEITAVLLAACDGISGASLGSRIFIAIDVAAPALAGRVLKGNDQPAPCMSREEMAEAVALYLEAEGASVDAERLRHPSSKNPGWNNNVGWGLSKAIDALAGRVLKGETKQEIAQLTAEVERLQHQLATEIALPDEEACAEIMQLRAELKEVRNYLTERTADVKRLEEAAKEKP
jgi:hypothetical protein